MPSCSNSSISRMNCGGLARLARAAVPPCHSRGGFSGCRESKRPSSSLSVDPRGKRSRSSSQGKTSFSARSPGRRGPYLFRLVLLHLGDVRVDVRLHPPKVLDLVQARGQKLPLLIEKLDGPLPYANIWRKPPRALHESLSSDSIFLLLLRLQLRA
jgi:hypothetical protein